MIRIGPLSIANRDWWVFMWRSKDRCGIFRNKAGVIPGRWGFYILGFELGSRNSGKWFGVLLKRAGLWPW